MFNLCQFKWLGGLLLISSIALAAALPVSAADSAEQWHFEVFIDDKAVGSHTFSVQEEGDTRTVESMADFKYRLLFLTLYNYEHDNREVWDGPCLQRIESSTNANGKRYSVEGWQREDAFVVDSGKGREDLPECIMTFAYWNPDFLQQSRLLNTQNGEFLKVSVSEPVTETVQVKGTDTPVQSYRLAAGELELDLWYTADQQWVGLQTEAKGGRIMRYELR